MHHQYSAISNCSSEKYMGEKSRMSDDSEPPQKKMKSVRDQIQAKIDCILTNDKNLTPIIDESFFQDIPSVNVLVGDIKNPKDISKTILTLNDKLPLQELQHLKRVRKKEIIICSADLLNGNTVKEYLLEKTPEIEDVFEDFKEIKVPSLPPKVKIQFDAANKYWPCNFHPNKYYEKLAGGAFFEKDDLKIHKQNMIVAYETAHFYLKDNEGFNNVAVVTDPTIQSIVAIAINNDKHPIQHAAMLAIDKVAQSQNGGAWVANISDEIDVTERSIDKELKRHLSKKFPHLIFGAKKFKKKRDTTEELSSDLGPYLCTGYYIYLLKEPCVMCSMGLVHARINRVFFCDSNSHDGALLSKVKLQTLSSLNHRFEVFTGFL